MIEIEISLLGSDVSKLIVKKLFWLTRVGSKLQLCKVEIQQQL